MDNQFQRSFQHYALLKPPRKIIEIHAKITKAWSQAFPCSPAVLRELKESFLFVRDGIFSVADYYSTLMGVVVVVVVVVFVVAIFTMG